MAFGLCQIKLFRIICATKRSLGPIPTLCGTLYYATDLFFTIFLFFGQKNQQKPSYLTLCLGINTQTKATLLQIFTLTQVLLAHFHHKCYWVHRIGNWFGTTKLWHRSTLFLFSRPSFRFTAKKKRLGQEPQDCSSKYTTLLVTRLHNLNFIFKTNLYFNLTKLEFSQSQKKQTGIRNFTILFFLHARSDLFYCTVMHRLMGLGFIKAYRRPP